MLFRSESITNLIQDLGFLGTKDIDSMSQLFKKSFRVGSLFADMQSKGIILPIERADFLKKVLTEAKQVCAGQFAQNGYWADVSFFTCIFLNLTN